jgi:hypothetical protein
VFRVPTLVRLFGWKRNPTEVGTLLHPVSQKYCLASYLVVS